jgi:nitrogen fixation protein FixH
VADNYYEQELKFQGRIDSVDRAQKSGAAIVHDAAGQLFIKIPSAQLSQKFSGTVKLYRPSAPALDQEFPLAPGADGRQTINSSGLAAGPWTVCVAWASGGENFYLEQKITVAAK